MLHAVMVGLTALAISFLMPAALLKPVPVSQEQQRFLVVEAEEPANEQTVQLLAGGTITPMPLEEYLVGVLLSEMPMSFETEALKAQAVAARTFAVRQSAEGGKHEGYDLCGQSNCCQAWADEEILAEKLGSSWQTYRDKAAAAVEATAGEVLTYGGELIDAVYFSCSGGATEDAVAVWGGNVPYLRSVESPGEESAAKYHTTVTVGSDVFRKTIKEVREEADLSQGPAHWVGDLSRTEGGGVSQIEIGGVFFSGTQMRQLFSLNSTAFTLRYEDGSFIFDVYGYGHRVGMSQYGANAMAEDGRSYEDILQHYYSGAKLEEIE